MFVKYQFEHLRAERNFAGPESESSELHLLRPFRRLNRFSAYFSISALNRFRIQVKLVLLIGVEPISGCLKGICFTIKLQQHLVREKGLEPLRLSTLIFKTSLSTYSSTPALYLPAHCLLQKGPVLPCDI